MHFTLTAALTGKKVTRLAHLTFKHLKVAADIVAPPLIAISNNALLFFTTEWKLGRVTPFSKREKKDNFVSQTTIRVSPWSQRVPKFSITIVHNQLNSLYIPQWQSTFNELPLSQASDHFTRSFSKAKLLEQLLKQLCSRQQSWSVNTDSALNNVLWFNSISMIADRAV